MSNKEAIGTKADEARVFGPQSLFAKASFSQDAAATTPMPSIISRSGVKPRMALSWQPRRLHLVTAAPLDHAAVRRRKRVAVRTRVVEGAYIAAALGTAVVIWWSAR